MSLSLASFPRIIPGTYGRAKITFDPIRNAYFLHYDNVRWNGVYTDYSDSFENLYSQYDIAHGKVLLTGLGFGILLKALDYKKEVTSITVIEKYQDVVDAFLKYNKISSKVNIIIDDATAYTTDEEFDCLLPDHYETQSVDWKINDMNDISKRIKHKHYWPWSLELMFYRTMYPKEKYGNSRKEFLSNYSHELYSKWQEFIKGYFNGNENLLNIEEDRLLKYLTLFAGHHFYEE